MARASRTLDDLFGSGKNRMDGQTAIHGDGWRSESSVIRNKRCWRSERGRRAGSVASLAQRLDAEQRAALSQHPDTRGPDPAARFDEFFTRNGRPPQWRDSVYPFRQKSRAPEDSLGSLDFPKGNLR